MTLRRSIALVLFTCGGTLMLTAQNDDIRNNPLLNEWNTPFQTPPFGEIKTVHYQPAVAYAIEQARLDVNNIINDPEPASFGNTIVALDRCGLMLNRVTSLFFNMLEADATPEMQKAAYEITPMVTRYSNDVNLNPELFARVKAVYNARQTLSLNVEQSTLLEKTYRGFVRNGANLSPQDKEKYRSITEKLSDLSLKFKEHLLNETNSFTLHITDKEQLSGIPEEVKNAAREKAADKNLEGWLFDISMPNYVALMKYADDRSIRKRIFYAYNSRCFKGDDNDNQQIVVQITNLRLELAKLLGYPNYASWVLEERMAQTPGRVNEFLDQLQAASMPAANSDLREVYSFAIANGLNGDFMRWDWSYYSDKLAAQRFGISDQLLKPYFELEKVREGVFELCRRLYGLKFIRNEKIPVYQKEVEVYEVYDSGGRFLSVLYLDFFPRATKRGGAWMTVLREQHKDQDKDIRPLVQLVFNFTPPSGDTPSLLTFNEVETFLHEFGHGLHGMLSDVTYLSLAGTNVYQDFVELPSQILENYATRKGFLDMFARHYRNGTFIPDSLIRKLEEYQRFQAGYLFSRQLAFAKLDMAWHTVKNPVKDAVGQFEDSVISPLQVLPLVAGTNISVGFSHIFGGGYAAGYYSYKWAEVLDADAFSVFEKNGIFDPVTAESFRTNILSKGGTEHPMELYRRFRGGEPSVDALLRRSGLIK